MLKGYTEAFMMVKYLVAKVCMTGGVAEVKQKLVIKALSTECHEAEHTLLLS